MSSQTRVMMYLYRLILFAVIFALKSCVHSSISKRKNVLLILVDDLRPALGCYDDEIAVTPNIDRIASQSVLFKRAYAQQSLCAPSRNSMLTSRRPDTLHLYDVHSYWRDSVGNFTTLPEYFKLNGYETRSIGKIFHPGRSSNFTDDFPFSWSSPAFHPSTESFMNAAVCFNSVESILPRRNLICPVNIDNQPEQTLPDIQSIDEAQRLISKGFDKPYFIGVGLHKPHIPFRFPAEYLSYHDLTKFKNIQFDYLPNGLPIVAFNPYNDVRERDDMKASNISYPFGPIPHDLGWHIRQAYYASITYIDDLIGRLLNIVTLDDTIVVLTSDHGWSLGEHAEWAKYSNYETATRVPLIILAPGTKANIVRNVVELIDVFPTLVDLADLPPISRCNESELIETCTEGKSLVAHFELKLNRFDVFKESAISQYPRPGLFPTRQPNSDQPKLNEIKIMGYSIRTDQFRYTIWIRFDYKTFRRFWNETYGDELYDHSIDPHETINLAIRDPFSTFKRQLYKLLRAKLNDLE